jgi:hypothetical protein
MYATTSGDAVYEAAGVDVPSEMLVGDMDANLSEFERGFVRGVGGTITGSRRLTFHTYAAREFKFTGVSVQDLEGYVRFWIAGRRVYVLMVLAVPGTTVYPEHFFDAFNVN